MLGAAAILAAIPAAIVLEWWRIHRRAREISYVADGGRVAVSLIAVEEALTRAVEGEACVKKAAVRVYEDRVKRQVIIDAVMTLWEVANVTERNRACAQILRRRFNELMPEQSAVQVNLTVHRLTPRRDDTPRAEPPATAIAALPAPEPIAAAARPRGQSDFGDAIPAPSEDSAVIAVGDEALEGPPVIVDAIAEDDLYAGPTYPVTSDEDDAEDNYLGKPLPAPRGKRR